MFGSLSLERTITVVTDETLTRFIPTTEVEFAKYGKKNVPTPRNPHHAINMHLVRVHHDCAHLARAPDALALGELSCGITWRCTHITQRRRLHMVAGLGARIHIKHRVFANCPPKIFRRGVLYVLCTNAATSC